MPNTPPKGPGARVERATVVLKVGGSVDASRADGPRSASGLAARSAFGLTERGPYPSGPSPWAAEADLVAALHDSGVPLVVVHGGGALVGEWSTRLGLETRFERGLRVTDEPTRDVALAVLAGLANARLVASLLRRGVPAVGLSGIDGGLIRAEREDGSLGLVGRITLVDSSLLEELLGAQRVPVIAPAAVAREDGDILNVNADSVAGAIAAAIGARLLAFVTDVPGVRGKDGRVIASLDAARAKALVDDGTIEGGMLPKVEACLVAAAAGCRAAIVASGGDSVDRLLAGERVGTVFEAVLA